MEITVVLIWVAILGFIAAAGPELMKVILAIAWVILAASFLWTLISGIFF
jgi:hypothetical protein